MSSISVNEAWGATALALVGSALAYAETGRGGVFLVPILLLALFVWRSGDGKSKGSAG